MSGLTREDTRGARENDDSSLLATIPLLFPSKVRRLPFVKLIERDNSIPATCPYANGYFNPFVPDFLSRNN